LPWANFFPLRKSALSAVRLTPWLPHPTPLAQNGKGKATVSGPAAAATAATKCPDPPGNRIPGIFTSLSPCLKTNCSVLDSLCLHRSARLGLLHDSAGAARAKRLQQRGGLQRQPPASASSMARRLPSPPWHHPGGGSRAGRGGGGGPKAGGGGCGRSRAAPAPSPPMHHPGSVVELADADLDGARRSRAEEHRSPPHADADLQQLRSSSTLLLSGACSGAPPPRITRRSSRSALPLAVALLFPDARDNASLDVDAAAPSARGSQLPGGCSSCCATTTRDASPLLYLGHLFPFPHGVMQTGKLLETV
jgi:hypothetical protein